jgi:hypothetical protein
VQGVLASLNPEDENSMLMRTIHRPFLLLWDHRSAL